EHHTHEPLTAELEHQLTARLRSSDNPEEEAGAIIDELRELGHDLHDWGESGDDQVWCADWVCPSHEEYELVVRISYPEDAPPAARLSFLPREPASDSSSGP